MSFFTGTVGEVIYNMPGAGTAYNTSTSATVISANSASNPPFQMPTPLWQPSYASARLLRIVAGGTYGTTVSTPTLIIGAYLDPTQNSTTSQIALAKTGTYTMPATAITNGSWLMDFYVTVNQIGVGAGAYATLVYTNGLLNFYPNGNNAATVNTGNATIGIGSPGATISINPMATYFLELWATWGTSSASNTIQCTQFTVFGLN